MGSTNQLAKKGMIEIKGSSAVSTRQMHTSDLHILIGADQARRPYIIIDDPDSGKVLAVALKAQQQEETAGSSYPSNQRIFPINNEQYYLIAGVESDFKQGDNHYESPEERMRDFVYRKKYTDKELPPGSDIAEVVKRSLEEKINPSQEIIGRPRYCDVVLISNPQEAQEGTKIYVMEHARIFDQVTIDYRRQAAEGTHMTPAYAVADKDIWKLYSEKVAGFESPDLEDKLACGMSALLEFLVSMDQDKEAADLNPELFDIVTVPFIPPEGNKSRARYDPEYARYLYGRAHELADFNRVLPKPKKKATKKRAVKNTARRRR